ncbi:MAG: BamA/TamA family outer membrane protein [candidate division WOR-3 bacterium]
MILIPIIVSLEVNLHTEGANNTSERFLREELRLEDFGFAETQSEIDSLIADREKGLMTTGIFAFVKGAGAIGDSAVEIWFLFYELPIVIPSPTLGYDDRSGWTGGLILGFPNLWGRAHKGRLGGYIGGIDALTAGYIKPPTPGHRGALDLSFFWGGISWAHEEMTERRMSAGFSLGKAFWWPNLLKLGVSYESRLFDTTVCMEKDSADELMGWTISWERSDLDNPMNPKLGTSVNISFSSNHELAKGGSFQGLSANARGFSTTGRLTIAGRIRLDMFSSETPYYKMQYLGGLYALRCYPYPTEISPSRLLLTLEGRTLVYSWTHPAIPFPTEFYLVPFAEAGALGMGEDFWEYLWGAGLGAGVFTIASGYLGGDVSINREREFGIHAYVGWLF